MCATGYRQAVPESVFISYAHEDAELARWFARELQAAGYRVWIDEGELRVGDSLIERISTGIRGAQFVLALVSTASVGSNWCRRELSMAISGELRPTGVRVLPLRVGDVEMPVTLEGVFYQSVDPAAPAIEPILRAIRHDAAEREDVGSADAVGMSRTAELTGPITIEGVIVAEVGSPRNDGSRGAALYSVPLKLSRAPTARWVRFFVAAWDSPPRSTSRHRPGIASVVGDQIVLAGTTMEEIEQVHLTTLRLALDEANRQESDGQAVETAEAQRQAEVDQAHAAEVRATAGRLRFDADAHDRIGPDDPLIVVSDLRVELIDPAAQAQSPYPPSPNQLVISIMNGGTGPGFQIEGNAHFSWSGGAWQALGCFDPIPALPAGVTLERRFRASAGAPWPSYVTAGLVRIEGRCRDRRDQEHSFGDRSEPMK